MDDTYCFFEVDIWYKALIVVGGLLMISAAVLPLTFIENKSVFIFGFGCFVIGRSEWFLPYNFICVRCHNFKICPKEEYRREENPLYLFLPYLGYFCCFYAVLHIFSAENIRESYFMQLVKKIATGMGILP